MAIKNKPEQWEDESMSVPVPRASIQAGLREVDQEGKPTGKDAPKGGKKHDKIRAILTERTEQLSTAKGILEVHPDLRLAKEISVAQILSPKDLSDYDFRLTINKVLYKEKVRQNVIERVQELLNTHLELEEKAAEYLGDILYDHGAVVHLILPPAKIDDLVSNTIDLESFDSTTNDTLFPDLNKHVASSEALTKAGIDGIHDNYKVFYRKEIREALVDRSTKGYDFESFSFAFDDPKAEENEMLTLDDVLEEDRRVQALRIRLSPDIILPICDPSDKSKKFGYYILADDNGHLTTSCQDSGFMSDLLSRLKKALHDENSQEYTIVKDLGFIDKNQDKKAKETVDGLLEKWVDLVEAPIREQIGKSGIVHRDVDVKDCQNFYRILLSRHLKKKKTRIIFVPAKLVSYMAFDFNELGHGISLLEQTAYYSSIRAIVQLTGIMNMVHNSIPTTDVNITLDEDDDDPMGTIETIVHELSSMTTLNFPIGTVNPSDIITSLQKAAYRIKVDGGTMFPSTSTEMSDSGKNRTQQLNTDLDDQLRRKQYAGLGVSPDAIDQSLQGEFATQIILNDILSAKRAMNKQRKYKACLKEYIQRVIEFSPYFVKELKDLGIKDVARFVRALEIVMPTADTSRIEQQAESWDRLNRFVDEVFPSIISDDMLRGIAGIDGEYTRDMLDDVRNIFASGVKREWLRENNILPDIWRAIDPDKENGLTGEISEHYTKTFKAVAPIVKSVLKAFDANDDNIRKYLDNRTTTTDEDGNTVDTGSMFGSGMATPFDEKGNPFQSPISNQNPEDPFALDNENPVPEAFGDDDVDENVDEFGDPIEQDPVAEDETDPFAEEEQPSEEMGSLEEEGPEDPFEEQRLGEGNAPLEEAEDDLDDALDDMGGKGKGKKKGDDGVIDVPGTKR